MRERLDIRRVNGHHRVEEEGKVYALRLDRQFKGIAITIERPWPFPRGGADSILIHTSEQSIPERAVGCLLDQLNGVGRDRDNRNNGHDH
jgi:hypothetical protein